MHALRTSTRYARLVLAWFVLTLGVAIASPIVHPQAIQLACSDGGAVRLVMVDENGQPVSASSHTLDCSLCLGTPLPADVATPSTDHPQPLAHALHPIAAAHIAAIVGAPLPPRGPPVSI